MELKCDQNIENIDILISPSIIRIENDVYNMNGNEYFGWIDFNITFIKGQTDYIFSSDMNNTFLVFGNWWFETGSKSGFIEPSIGTFEFSTICDYEVFYSLNENQYIGSVGEWKRIPIRIINVGNIEVEIQITGFFYLHDDLDIKVDPNEIIIPEGEERIINLSVKQKNGFGKTHQINLHFLGRAENEEKQKNKDIPYKTHSTVYSIIDYICDVRIITVSIIWIICLVIIIKFVKRNRTKKSK
ncbi:MAG: hypothetical protein KAH05_05415 [Clostridiales bacterium]|nr:hypothetical protein [Clostridiales bacterium]